MQKLSEIPRYRTHALALEQVKARLAPHFGRKRVDAIEVFVTRERGVAEYDPAKGIITVHPDLLDYYLVESFTDVVAHEYGHVLMQHEPVEGAERWKKECESDQFAVYFGAGGKGLVALLTRLRALQPDNSTTHPLMNARITAFGNAQVMGSIPGTVSFDEQCHMQQRSATQDASVPVAYAVSRVRALGFMDNLWAAFQKQVRFQGLLDLNGDDPVSTPQIHARYSDTIEITPDAVRFYPTGTGLGAKSPQVLKDDAVLRQLGPEAMEAVQTLRQQVMQGAPVQDYTGRYEGAPTALYVLHQKLAQEQRRVEGRAH